jgi:hypothetical protein
MALLEEPAMPRPGSFMASDAATPETTPRGNGIYGRRYELEELKLPEEHFIHASKDAPSIIASTADTIHYVMDAKSIESLENSPLPDAREPRSSFADSDYDDSDLEEDEGNIHGMYRKQRSARRVHSKTMCTAEEPVEGAAQ